MGEGGMAKGGGGSMYDAEAVRDSIFLMEAER